MINKAKLPKTILNDFVMDSMPGNAFIFSEDGHLVAWNKNAEEYSGYSSYEMPSKTLLDFVEPNNKEDILNNFKSVFEAGSGQLEYSNITKDGKSVPTLATARIVSVDDHRYMIALWLDISELSSMRGKVKEQVKEISRLNELLHAENKYLKDQLKLTATRNELIGDSEPLKYILFKISKVAPTDATVLIEGETGTGKELVARALHRESKRSNKPFIKVNCASIPENLIESELFGHEKGAFTGAFEKRIGRFELANEGTLFLDEIGELPMSVQPKLLHILQQGEFERIGSSKTIKTNVRIIAATNKILADEIKNGNFRNDLFYRLNVFPISVSPLRERKTDIPALIEYYLKYYSDKLNKQIDSVSKESMQMLMDYNWPGNIRELENVIERAIITSNDKVLNVDIIPLASNTPYDYVPLEEVEKVHIIRALEKTFWKISGTGGAASLLKINPETLRSKMRKLGIRREKTS